MATRERSSVMEGLAAEAPTSRAKEFVRTFGYGMIMAGSLLILWWAVEYSPFPLEVVSNALFILMIAVIVSLEIWIPFTKSWGDIRNVTRADVIYFLLAAPLDALHMFLLIGLLAATQPFHHYLEVVSIWPKDAHVLIQLFIAINLVDFTKYWYHRWTHEVPLLWRIHSVHHSLEWLEMLRASYFYPIDIFLTVGIGTMTMLAFGVPYEVILFHNVWAGITGLMNHSNADLRCGFFDSFLNSPGHHRAHHSVGLPGSGSNYGSFLNFTDRIFGTRYLPEDQSSFDPLGLDESYPEYPRTFLKQLAVPFRWNEVHRTK